MMVVTAMAWKGCMLWLYSTTSCFGVYIVSIEGIYPEFCCIHVSIGGNLVFLSGSGNFERVTAHSVWSSWE